MWTPKPRIRENYMYILICVETEIFSINSIFPMNVVFWRKWDYYGKFQLQLGQELGVLYSNDKKSWGNHCKAWNCPWYSELIWTIPVTTTGYKLAGWFDWDHRQQQVVEVPVLNPDLCYWQFMKPGTNADSSNPCKPSKVYDVIFSQSIKYSAVVMAQSSLPAIDLSLHRACRGLNFQC